MQHVHEIFLRSPFNYDRDKASRDTALHTPEPTRTQQQFKDETDINTIVRNFGLTGELPSDLKTPMQGDFTAVVDYQSALNLVMAADDAFGQLPAAVRKRFDNDPQLFLEFVSDEKNLDEARALGIANPAAKAPEPTLVKIVDPAPGKPAA